jgi:hypothetical protein
VFSFSHVDAAQAVDHQHKVTVLLGSTVVQLGSVDSYGPVTRSLVTRTSRTSRTN